MSEITQNKPPLSFLLSEANGGLSREKITLIAGQNLKATTVLGKITASGKYTILAPVAADGSQNAAAILAFDTNATAADQTCTGVVRVCEVIGDQLTYPGGITAPQKTAAIAALAAQYVLVR